MAEFYTSYVIISVIYRLKGDGEPFGVNCASNSSHNIGSMFIYYVGCYGDQKFLQNFVWYDGHEKWAPTIPNFKIKVTLFYKLNLCFF